MKVATIIGIDLAKSSIQLYGVDSRGKAVLKKNYLVSKS